MTLSFLSDLLPAEHIHRAEPLARHTSFKIGGKAQALVEPQTEEQLADVLKALGARAIPYFILGRGTNVLISDEGFEGVVIRMTFSQTASKDGLFFAGSGLSLRKLYERAMEDGFTGLEFAAGIPGTVGGAVRMNAGAYGGEIKNVLHSVRVLRPDGVVMELPARELELSYRSSCISRANLIVLSAAFRLPRGDVEESRRIAGELMERRRSRQPLELPSAGSTFRRPPGHFAGTLIEMCGLKGASCGGAQVSTKHAGFIVNTGDATARDVCRLIHEVQRMVQLLTGVRLQPEVETIGTFESQE